MNDTPTREEWDFSYFKGCAQNPIHVRELLACHEWEYNRERPEVTKRVLEWRDGCADFETLSQDAFDFEIEDSLLPFTVFRFSPEWPASPFLSLRKTERQRRVKLLEAELFGDSAMPSGENIAFSLDELRNHPTENGVAWSDRDPVVYAAFQLDLRRSDDSLKKDFSAWLAELRAAVNTQPKETRGQSNLIRRFQTELNQLGAFRLLSCFSWDDAFLHTKEITGRALYGDNPDGWRRAKKAAEKTISKESD